MRSACWTFSRLVVLMAGAAVVVAQQRSDFSGQWKPIEPPGGSSTRLPPTTSGDLPPVPRASLPPPPRILSITIAQSAAELKIDRRMETGGEVAVDRFVYKLDGTESVNEIRRVVYRTKAAWDGAALVLSSAVSSDGKSLGQETDIYRIENGELVIASSLQNFRGTFSLKRVYRKE